MVGGIYDYRLPSPGLLPYVRQYQIVGCHFPADVKYLPVKAYWPRAENCLSFTPRDQEQVEYGFDGKLQTTAGCRLIGQHTMATNRHVGRDFLVFQVVFQPGALYRLCGIPSNELTNRFIDAELVFGPEIKRVIEQLRNTIHHLDMVPIVENFLWQLIRQSKHQAMPVDKVGLFLLANPNQWSLDWMADQACLSPRQFYRQFVAREGVSPKLYARIARFENAMKIKNAHPRKDWFSVAIDLGYYDYQHLVRDFKEFTTLTPTAYYLAAERGPEKTFGISET